MGDEEEPATEALRQHLETSVRVDGDPEKGENDPKGDHETTKDEEEPAVEALRQRLEASVRVDGDLEKGESDPKGDHETKKDELLQQLAVEQQKKQEAPRCCL